MSKESNSIDRSILISRLIKGRQVQSIQDDILSVAVAIGLSRNDYMPLGDRGISQFAWQYINNLGIEPWRAFSHEEILLNKPELSVFYRGLSLLSQKAVQNLVTNVADWEDPEKKPRVSREKVLDVTTLYNRVICKVIESTPDWNMEDGRANVIATVAIGLDGSFRNLLGKRAEDRVRDVIMDFLRHKFDDWDLTREEVGNQWVTLPSVSGDPEIYEMKFASEPDVAFRVDYSTEVATIEIKGGTDRAGALERLGAIEKSFGTSEDDVVNFLFLGVETSQMKERLRKGIKKYLLDDLNDPTMRAQFLDELFHHTVRIVDSKIGEEDIP